MINGKIMLGKYRIEPNINMSILEVDEFNIIDVKGNKVFISKKPLEFCNSLFWVTIYTKDSNIAQIELSNADEKYKMNYKTMNNTLIENLRRENAIFLQKLLGNPSVTNLTGVQYEYSWGKVFSYFDNKSAESGIVIDYIK